MGTAALGGRGLWRGQAEGPGLPDLCLFQCISQKRERHAGASGNLIDTLAGEFACWLTGWWVN